jgi:hypothetical protein
MVRGYFRKLHADDRYALGLGGRTSRLVKQDIPNLRSCALAPQVKAA